VAGFAVDSLARTIGRALLRAHGYSNLLLVEIPAPFFESMAPSDAEFDAKTLAAVERALKILKGENMEKGA
jgi:hypothetical protein